MEKKFIPAIEKDYKGTPISLWRAIYPVAHLFESSFGPRGFDKLIFDAEHNSLVVSSDGYALVRELRDLIEHPIPKALLKVAKKHARVYGDQTKYLVIMTSAILKEFENLVIDQGLTAPKILNGMKPVRPLIEQELAASRHVLNIVGTDASEHVSTLFRLVLKETFGSLVTDHLVSLMTRAFQTYSMGHSRVPNLNSFDPYAQFEFKEHFLTHKLAGGGILDSSFLDGILLSKGPAHPNMPRQLKKPRTCLTTDMLYVDKPEEDRNIEVLLSRPEDVVEMRRYQLHRAERIRDILREHGVNFLVSEKGLSRELEDLLAQDGVLAIRRVDAKELRVLANGAKIPVNTRILDLVPTEIFEIAGVSVEHLRGDEVTRVKLNNSPGGTGCFGGTFVIQGGVFLVCEEVERHLISAMRAVLGAFSPKIGGLLPGGAVIDLKIARALRDEAAQTSSSGQLVLEAVARAFERPFTILVESAGLDPISAISKSRKVHSQNSGINWGIGFPQPGLGIIPTALEEFYLPKLRAIQASLAFATQMLRVDRIFHHDRKIHGD